MAASTLVNTLAQQLIALGKAWPWTAFCVSCALTCLLTRLWTGLLKFRLESQTNSTEKGIPILPYWIPYIGHAPSIGIDFDGTLTRGRNATKDGIFGISMLGYKHYMVLTPSLTKQYFVQRNSVMSSDSFIHWIFAKYFGDGGASQRIGHDNFHAVHQSLNSMLREPFLSVGSQLTATLCEQLTPEMVSFSPGKQQPWELGADVSTVDDKSVEADLFALSVDYVAYIATQVFMGSAFLRNNPGIIQDLWTLDNSFNALLTNIPVVTRGLAKAKAARARLNIAFAEWNEALRAHLNDEDPGPRWREPDLSDVSETMKIRIKAYQQTGADEAFRTSQSLAVYWGLLVNANKVIFWMLLHIISTPELLTSIRKEIAAYAIFDADGDLKIEVDSLLKSCPVFKATFYETMRLYVAGTSYKKVHQDLSLTESPEDAKMLGKKQGQTYHIKKGSFLVIPHATMQTDPRLWEDPTEFRHERFLVLDEEKHVKADQGFLNPWGGGPSMCKGRFFAEREVLTFIAAYLTCWEFRPADADRGWKLPDRFYNGTGTANPKEVVRVRMSRRR